MIGKLTGTIDLVETDHVILDVNGVGYIVYCTSSTLSRFAPKMTASLLTNMVVKEDQLTLYGFLEKSEKEWFTNLQDVQGVGAKMALAILSTHTPQSILTAIMAGDNSAFKQVSGVGPKLAARIVNELKNKKGLMDNAFSTPAQTSAAPIPQAANNNSTADAVSALSNLGFSRSDAFTVVSQLQADNDDMPLEDLIRLGLSKLSGN